MRFGSGLHWNLLLGLGLRGGGAISAFLLTWLVARIFGPEEVGLYQLGLSTALFVAAFVNLGLDMVLLRELGAMLKAGDWSAARASYETCRRYVLQFGLLATVGLAVFAYPVSVWILGEPRSFPFLLVFAVITLLAPLLALGNVILRSAGHVFQSQALEGVTYTTLACGVLVLAMLFGWSLSPLLPACAYVGSVSFVVAINYIAVGKVLSRGDPGGRAAIDRWAGLRIAILRTATQGGNLGLLMLVTAFLSLADTGVFRTAFQICMIFQLVATSFALMVGPHISQAVAARDVPGLVRQLRTIALLGIALCSPLIAIVLLFPDFLLGLFGPEFVQGSTAMVILMFSQVIEIGLGQPGLPLVIMKRENHVLHNEIIANVIGLGAAALFIPSFGMAGAATGALVIALIRNLANMWYLRRELHRLRLPA